MSHIKTRLSVAVGTLLLSAGLALAQPESKTTYITFDAPVSLPGVTLAPGTYTFKLLDSQTNRHIVQVFDRERSKIFATILAIPAERMEVTDETVITFRETPANAPAAIRYWYYPGDKIGQEFAYPKEQAMLIARASGESVLAYETTSSDVEAMKTAELTRVEAGAAAETPPETPTEQPAPQAAVTPQPTDTQPAAPSAEAQPTGTSGRQLPQTAGDLPLVGFIGLLALGGALIARTLRAAL